VKKTLTLLVVFCMLSLCAGSSRAAIIFSDDFNSHTAGIPWPGEIPWTVSDGSVDLIGEGTSWDLQPGNGLYLDMDGSTWDAGKITSVDIALDPGKYILSFDVAGNWRRDGQDAITVELAGLFGSSIMLADNVPFTTFSTGPLIVAAPMLTTISFEGWGSDNVGLLLDNVVLETVEGVIPAPGAVLLGGIGVGIVGWLRRRRVV
jgi:hypothetical protein